MSHPVHFLSVIVIFFLWGHACIFFMCYLSCLIISLDSWTWNIAVITFKYPYQFYHLHQFQVDFLILMGHGFVLFMPCELAQLWLQWPMPFYNPLAWWEDITLMITLHYVSKEIKFKSQIISTDQEINCLLWAWPFSWTLTRKVDRDKKSQSIVFLVALKLQSPWILQLQRKQNFPIVKWTWRGSWAPHETRLTPWLLICKVMSKGLNWVLPGLLTYILQVMAVILSQKSLQSFTVQQ